MDSMICFWKIQLKHVNTPLERRTDLEKDRIGKLNEICQSNMEKYKNVLGSYLPRPINNVMLFFDRHNSLILYYQDDHK